MCKITPLLPLHILLLLRYLTLFARLGRRMEKVYKQPQPQTVTISARPKSTLVLPSDMEGGRCGTERNTSEELEDGGVFGKSQ